MQYGIFRKCCCSTPLAWVTMAFERPAPKGWALGRLVGQGCAGGGLACGEGLANVPRVAALDGRVGLGPGHRVHSTLRAGLWVALLGGTICTLPISTSRAARSAGRRTVVGLAW